MPTFSEYSKRNLDTADQQLQRIFNHVIVHRDCRVLKGHRGETEQTRAYESGTSKTPWPNSKHNRSPSEAVDVMPYYAERPHVRWPPHPNKNLEMFLQGDIDQATFLKNEREFWELQAFANFVMGVASMYRIALRWGGHFRSFFDGPHYELIRNG